MESSRNTGAPMGDAGEASLKRVGASFSSVPGIVWFISQFIDIREARSVVR